MRPLLLLPIFALLISCGEEEEAPLPPDPQWSQEQSIEMNSNFAGAEDEEIERFLDRHLDWFMTKTGTGLRYMIYQHGESEDSAKVDDIVKVDFEISLLDGTVCYNSSENGAETFVVEKTDIESGLHEGIKYMSVGDRAKFILPSRMAHGLIGDSDKIPPLTPVIYDITLIEIQQQ